MLDNKKVDAVNWNSMLAKMTRKESGTLPPWTGGLMEQTDNGCGLTSRDKSVARLIVEKLA